MLILIDHNSKEIKFFKDITYAQYENIINQDYKSNTNIILYFIDSSEVNLTY